LKGKIFYVHGTGPDISSFDRIIRMVNEGTKFLIFSSVEEVEAWEELENRWGEMEGVWAIAIGKGVASAIHDYTNIKKVLLYEGKLDELPNTLGLLGIR
jgi:uroporphyrinogen-III synthase